MRSIDVRRVVGLDVAKQLARQRRVRAEAAADQDVIALDGVAVLRDRHLAGDQADVADVVLRAGMMAAGEMDVHRRVELDARLAPARDLLGMALGVGGGEPAAGVAGAGDQAGADRARLGGKAERLDRAPRPAATLSAGTPEISRFCQTVSRISPSPRSLRDLRPARASASPVSLPTGSTTPIQFKPVCFCACTPM